ncbi:TRAP transporter small permease [Rhodococcus pseudokoreensis]|uniref:TRAP transporter small permease n=1 Tax=Rhodococcus pseudokoreensis TaxID=2811421 RepID=A0A974WEC9_9NOCA|nr:TRAP transporter small permease [Rhodococcus pseudokoreensis]
MAGIIVLILTVQIAADVLARNHFNKPIPGTLELTANLFMPLIIFLSLAYAEYAGDHIRATIVVARLTGRTAKATELIGRIVTLLVVLALTYYAVIGATYATEIRLEALGAITLPVWPVKILAAVGLALFAVQLLASTAAPSTHTKTRNDHG